MIDMYGRDKVEQMLHENKVVKLSRADLEDMEAEWKIEINEHLKRIG